jgi:23S rRNA pseudouridine1911/1915/1917 synthase
MTSDAAQLSTKSIPARNPVRGQPPAGLRQACRAGHHGRPRLVNLAKEYLKRRYVKAGNVYLGVVSRLDAPVTGVVLFARTSKAARRLTDQFRSQSVQKIYWALVEGRIEPAEGELVDWLAHYEPQRRMQVVASGAAGAKEARLSYRRLVVAGDRSLVELEPHTGRKHQIRLQLASRGHPVLGDRKYGSRTTFAAGIALHARRLVIVHPVRGEPVAIEAPLPAAWPRFARKR